MMKEPLTFRDRVKFACLKNCVDAGLSEEEMIERFHRATSMMKSASLSLLSPTAKALGSLAVLGIPVTGLGAATLGNVFGKTMKNVEIGRIPSVDEIKLLDEIATYHRTAEEVKRRTEENEQEKKQRAKPSVRRMF